MASVHTVSPGDTLISIAHDHGFLDWRTIWEHDDNAGLRAKRPNPQVLAPGDQVQIPEKEPHWETVATNERHVFELVQPTTMVRLAVCDQYGVPYTGRPFTLLAGGRTTKSVVGEGGLVTAEIEAGTKDARLEVELGNGATRVFELQIGHLDPLSEVRGVKSRLANLGLYAGAIDDEWGEDAEDALTLFQRLNGLEGTGELDEKTREVVGRVSAGG